MSGVDVHISVNNIPQFDRHQSNAHRTPILHQQANGDIARSQLEQQAKIPTEPKGAEGKSVDPDNRKKDNRRSKKRKKEAPQEVRVSEEKRMADSGGLIDIEA